MAEGGQFIHAAPRLGVREIVEGNAQVANPHLPQGQERIIVSDPLASECVQPPGRGYIGAVAPGLAQIEAGGAPRGRQAVNGRQGSGLSGRVVGAAMGAMDVIYVSLAMDSHNRITKLRGVVPSLLHTRRHTEQFVVIVTQETSRRHRVTTGFAVLIEEEVMDMPGVEGFDLVALQDP